MPILLFVTSLFLIIPTMTTGCQIPYEKEKGLDGAKQADLDPQNESRNQEYESRRAEEAEMRRKEHKAEQEKRNTTGSGEQKQLEEDRASNLKDANSVREATEVEYDDIRKDTFVKGPHLYVDKDTSFWLFANFDRDQTHLFELVVHHFRVADISNFQYAYASTGRRLEIMWIGAESNIENGGHFPPLSNARRGKGPRAQDETSWKKG